MTGVSQPASGDRDEGFGYRWIILAVGILAYGTSQFSRQNYTGVQKFIADDLSLDRGTLGLMGSAFFYAYALFQMPWGIASDRFGSRAIIGLGIHVITPNAGLRSPDVYVTPKAVAAFADGDVHQSNVKYRKPLEKSARALLEEIGPDCEVVLLGSVASPKYVDVLTAIFGDRLLFPIDFVGRGDMSRGGLLLRQAREGVELPYVPVRGAVLHGARPPKLPPIKWAARG